MPLLGAGFSGQRYSMACSSVIARLAAQVAVTAGSR